ncbi:conserved hypothetical protein [Mycoplasma haemofelis str. Langford 1]|uniref:Uncharacterized protein n=1 Tax=Mycoplasma haemofelis (strain Langford 1) TaxID=941640 RepID=E8ZKR5_MYCHL|nr:HAD family hydrolase [Mycoplasma haemofelis]CBY92231.1 conserved hypothetical protein [Mycoplasma haemofelis str. Langford 1]
MKIKCIFIDIDGTLVKESGYLSDSVSSENLEAIKDYCSSGGKIVLATGRDISTTLPVVKQITQVVDASCIPYLICMNGSFIYNSDGTQILVRKSFDPEIPKNFAQIACKSRLNFFLVNSQREIFFTNKPFSWLIYLLLFRKRYPRKRYSKDMDFSNIQKAMIFLKLPRVAYWRSKLVPIFKECYFSSGPKCFLELVDKRINKWYAAQEVLRYLGIGAEEVASFGNEGNDILSLESAAFGVGFDLKEKTHLSWDDSKIQFHTTNEDCCGVYRAIKEMKNRGLY